MKLKKATMRDWAKALIWERVPADVADPRAKEKAAALAKEFVEHHPWAKSQADKFDLDELCVEVLGFARDRGYDLLDEPPCEYTPAPEVWIRCWGPEEK